jgi:hypothetical protein
MRIRLLVLAAGIPAFAADLAITGAKVFPSPEAAPLSNATVLIPDGKIAALGQPGDLTVLSADPSSQGLTAFTQVRYTIRGGRVIFEKR